MRNRLRVKCCLNLYCGLLGDRCRCPCCLKRLLRESGVTLDTCKEEGCVHLVQVERRDNRFPSQPKNKKTKTYLVSNFETTKKKIEDLTLLQRLVLLYLTCRWCGRSGGSTSAYWSSDAPQRTNVVPHGRCVQPLELGSACRTDSFETRSLSVWH